MAPDSDAAQIRPPRLFVILVATVLVAGVTSGCSAQHDGANSTSAVSTARGTVRQLDPAEFAAAIAGQRVTINVHVPDEGSLPDTDLTIPYDDVASRVDQLPADRTTPVAIYCMTGHMSAIAGQELGRLGYTDIVELRGGMLAWKADGRPLLP